MSPEEKLTRAVHRVSQYVKSLVKQNVVEHSRKHNLLEKSKLEELLRLVDASIDAAVANSSGEIRAAVTEVAKEVAKSNSKS